MADPSRHYTHWTQPVDKMGETPLRRTPHSRAQCTYIHPSGQQCVHYPKSPADLDQHHVKEHGIHTHPLALHLIWKQFTDSSNLYCCNEYFPNVKDFENRHTSHVDLPRFMCAKPTCVWLNFDSDKALQKHCKDDGTSHSPMVGLLRPLPHAPGEYRLRAPSALGPFGLSSLPVSRSTETTKTMDKHIHLARDDVNGQTKYHCDRPHCSFTFGGDSVWVAYDEHCKTARDHRNNLYICLDHPRHGTDSFEAMNTHIHEEHGKKQE